MHAYLIIIVHRLISQTGTQAGQVPSLAHNQAKCQQSSAPAQLPVLISSGPSPYPTYPPGRSITQLSPESCHCQPCPTLARDWHILILKSDHQIVTYFRLRAAGLYAAYRPPSAPRQCRLSHGHGRWHPNTRLRGTRVYSTGHAGRFRSPCLQGRPKKTLTYCPNPPLMSIILTNRLIVKVTGHSCLCRL